MIIKTIFKYMLVSTMVLGLTFAQSETEVDPIEKARQAKEAADKAAAEAEALKEAAVEAAAQKAAKEARETAKRKKEEAEARKIADKQAAEEAELDAAAQAAADEAKRKMAAELGLDLEVGDDTDITSGNTDDTSVVSDTASAEEEHYVSEGPGFNIGISGSAGLVQGSFFDKIPVGGSLVITTPWGFDLGGLRFGLSATVGAYPAKHNTGEEFTPLAIGVGGNLTLARLLFSEGHVGLVGDATGARGFAGISLENMMKKGLNLPFNILIGGEGFMSTDLKYGSATYWGGVAIRLDYNL